MKQVVIEMRLGAPLAEEDLVRRVLELAKALGVADASYAVARGAVEVRDGLGNAVGTANVTEGPFYWQVIAELERKLVGEGISKELHLRRALDAEKQLAKCRSVVATFLEGLEGLRRLA